MPERSFGPVAGYPEGSLFENRAELRAAGVHRHPRAGISGSQKDGAESIVLSGGYEDDQDFGDEIIYTGYGGRDPETGRQTHDQPFTRWNRALAYSGQNGLPVRVIRGSDHDSPYSPATGYSYDGLYAVEDFWHEVGRSGFKIWRFRLVKIPDEVISGSSVAETPAEYSVARRREVSASRIVRDTAQARKIKALYDYRCQMCGTRLVGAAGPYAETAHIRPLGIPHNGPDTPDNILCLCPNHHVLLDYGGVGIAEDLSLIGEEGKLTVHPEHHISSAHISYLRDHYQSFE